MYIYIYIYILVHRRVFSHLSWNLAACYAPRRALIYNMPPSVHLPVKQQVAVTSISIGVTLL